MVELGVDLGARSYPILIGSGLLGQAAPAQTLRRYIAGRQVAIVTNTTVSPLYLNKVKAMLEGVHPVDIILPDGESFKNLSTLEQIFDALLKAKHTRKTTIIALGGGVVGDMAGFAAATYQRGVDFIQIPTTLLAQVDSSVGGKTGVNHPLGKNMIGAFHQPNMVLIDTDSLTTLPNRELSAGLAEVIKYGLICDAEFYHWLQQNMSALMARDEAALRFAIHRSCIDKAKIVAEDEKESGIRAILNLGHTFGHAIETHMGYGEWLHGEAVAVGMVMAAKLSHKAGDVDEQIVDDLTALLSAAGLPVEPPKGLRSETFMELMAVDKKAVDGKLKFVLLKAVGEAVVTEHYEPDLLDAILRELCCT